MYKGKSVDARDSSIDRRGRKGSGGKSRVTSGRSSQPLPNLLDYPHGGDVQLFNGRLTAKAFNTEVPLIVRILDPKGLHAYDELMDSLAEEYQRARALHDGRSGEVLPSLNDGTLRDALDVISNARQIYMSMQGLLTLGEATTRYGVLADLSDSLSRYVMRRFDSLGQELAGIPYPDAIDRIYRFYVTPKSQSTAPGDFPNFAMHLHPAFQGVSLDRPQDFYSILDDTIDSLVALDTSLEAMRRYAGKIRKITDAKIDMSMTLRHIVTDASSAEVIFETNSQYRVPVIVQNVADPRFPDGISSVSGVGSVDNAFTRHYPVWTPGNYQNWMKLAADASYGTLEQLVIWKHVLYDNPEFTTYVNNEFGWNASAYQIHNVNVLHNDMVIKPISPVGSFSPARLAFKIGRAHLAEPFSAVLPAYTLSNVIVSHTNAAHLSPVNYYGRVHAANDIEPTIFRETLNGTKQSFSEMMRLVTGLEIYV